MLTRLLSLASATIVALALFTAPAPGKGIKSATVCGTDDCVAANVDHGDEQLLFGGAASDPPSRADARAEGFYRLEIAIGARDVEERLTLELLPVLGYMHSADNLGGSEWMAMSADQQALFQPLAAGLHPFPGTKLEGLSNPQLPAANTSPPPSPPAEPTGDDGGIWAWLVAGLGVAVAASLVVRRLRRRPEPAGGLRA